MNIDLFGAPPHNGTPTSIAAAEQIKKDASTLRGQVLRAIRSAKHMGATDLEIQAALDMEGSTERPRRQELQKKGLILDSGFTRPTPSGRQSVVWVAAEYWSRAQEAV